MVCPTPPLRLVTIVATVTSIMENFSLIYKSHRHYSFFLFQLTGAVSDLLGQATFDASYQEEREQVNESCQSSSDHLRAGLIGLSSGVFGGLTSMFTQPVRGAKEDGLGVSLPYILQLGDFISGSRASLLV